MRANAFLRIDHFFDESNSRHRRWILFPSWWSPNEQPAGRKEKEKIARDSRMFLVKIDSPERKGKGRRKSENFRDSSVRNARRAHAFAIIGATSIDHLGFSCPLREANCPNKRGEKYWLGFVDVANRADVGYRAPRLARYTPPISDEQMASNVYACAFIGGEGGGGKRVPEWTHA